ncbi:MAG: peptidylprolyl isomerase [Candidatus Woesearchaeota archaeon]|nr:MAG: peptidylprolyl isomerase [Candidatus Woesearchaeota archaeon]
MEEHQQKKNDEHHEHHHADHEAARSETKEHAHETQTVEKKQEVTHNQEPKKEQKQTAKKTTAKKKTATKKKVTAKKTTDKQAETKKAKPKKKRSAWPFVLGLIIVLVVIGGIGIYVGMENQENENAILLVNGEPITHLEFEQTKEIFVGQFPPEFLLAQNQSINEIVVNELIQERLVEQEGRKLGLTVTDEEVLQSLSIFLTINGVDLEGFKDLLEEQDISYETYLSAEKRRLLILKTVNETVFSKIAIGDNEAEAFYNENSDLFAMGEAVEVRHILIGNTERTDQEAAALAQQVMQEVSSENFCELVTQYSEDPGSLATCGTYEMTQDTPFVEQFKTAGFEMSVGELRIVKTDFGYHIMEKLSASESRTIPFEEAKADIVEQLKTDKARQLYATWLLEVTKNAEIEYLVDLSTLS